MTLETSKNLGGIGALLIFISPLIGYAPGIGGFTGILSIVGAILVLIGLKGFADYYKDNGIFNNALYAIIAAIIGGVAFVGVLVLAAVGLFAEFGLNISNPQDWASLSQIDWTAIGNLDLLLSFAGVIILGLVVLFIFLVIMVVFLRKSLSHMAARTGIGLFGTTGTLLLIGAVLVIILVGILLIWIAMLLLAIAFFSIRTQQQQSPAAPAQAPTQV